MITRNFWIDGKVDGRPTPIAAGPRSADGGFTLQILMRDAGAPSTPVTIEGRCMEDGTLILNVEVNDVYEVIDQQEEHPPSHRTIVQVRTHRDHAVRAGTNAAQV